jgi:hypothetical protein
MKIGITIDISRLSLFVSGINQNAIYLAMLLKEGGNDTYLIHVKDQDTKSLDQTKKLCKKHSLNRLAFNEVSSKKLDVVISLGVTISDVMANAWRNKNPNIKFISYKCGNEFFVDAETYIYKTHQERAASHSKITPVIPDAVWSIPQMENTNLHYYSFILGTENTTVVPFIWDPMLMEAALESNEVSIYDGRKINRIGIMEPNISLMKFCIPPAIIADRVFKNHKDIEIEKLMLIGANGIQNDLKFKELIGKMELYKAGKMSADARHATPFILDKYAHIIVSWQWENPLNYLYLDAAWLGYAVVHNAHLCKDVGYYYEGFDFENGEEVLYNAMKNHAEDSNYLTEQRKNITRYTRMNQNMVKQYNILLQDVVNDEFKRQVYDPLTNSVSPK